MDTLTSWIVATVGHVAHTQLLLVPTVVMDTLTLSNHCYYWTCSTPAVAASASVATGGLTSVDHCHCWTCGTCAVATSAYSSDVHWHQWTIATVGHVAHAQLLLAPTSVMDTLTSGDRCYCWTRGTHMVAASAHSSEWHLTSVDRCYYWTCGTCTTAASAHSSDVRSDISGPLLLLDTWHTRSCC
jgi:hypothetical protein